jgi:hypothetical protein
MLRVVVGDNISMGGAVHKDRMLTVVSYRKERSASFVIFDIANHNAVVIRKSVVTHRGKWLPCIRVAADKGLNEGYRTLCLVQWTLVRPHRTSFPEGISAEGRRISNMCRKHTYIHIYMYTNVLHTYIQPYKHTFHGSVCYMWKKP